MKFAELLPKTNVPTEEEGGLIFCSTEEGVKRVAENRPAGKLLFVTDGSALGAFRTCLPPRALCLVLDSGDCLPLFASSDDVSSVMAAGGKSTLVAARFFAGVRNIPCAVFPASADLDGAYEKFGEVQSMNAPARAPLADATVYCDESLTQDTAGGAYARLLLARLALIEARVLRGFGYAVGNTRAEEQAYGALLALRAHSLTFRDVVLKNALLRQCERDGMAEGEGVMLARLIGRRGEEQAFELLSALYLAFFAKGKPRLTVPDYGARARRAETEYASLRIPTPQEFAKRATRFEEMRAALYEELRAFLRGELHFRNNFYALAGRALSPARSLDELQILPERTAGLAAVIRDFGLMDWEEEAQNAGILRKSV